MARAFPETLVDFQRMFPSDPRSMFNSVLGIAAQTEGPTYEELYDGDWAHPAP